VQSGERAAFLQHGSTSLSFQRGTTPGSRDTPHASRRARRAAPLVDLEQAVAAGDGEGVRHAHAHALADGAELVLVVQHRDRLRVQRAARAAQRLDQLRGQRLIHAAQSGGALTLTSYLAHLRLLRSQRLIHAGQEWRRIDVHFGPPLCRMEASPFCSATLLPENAKAKNKGTEWLYFRMTYCLARLRLRYRRRSTRTRQGTGWRSQEQPGCPELRAPGCQGRHPPHLNCAMDTGTKSRACSLVTISRSACPRTRACRVHTCRWLAQQLCRAGLRQHLRYAGVLGTLR